MGGAVDQIVFAGLTAGTDVTVVLLDVKTGQGRLSPGQRRIRDAVNAGRVQFKIHRPPLPEPEPEAGLITDLCLYVPGQEEIRCACSACSSARNAGLRTLHGRLRALLDRESKAGGRWRTT